MASRQTEPRPPSMAGRATAAMLLTIGFYGLAIVIALALLSVPYFEWQWAHRVTGRLAIICVAGAGIILWSIVPRPDRFVAPGPRLEAARNPRLFAEAAAVATSVGEPMPKEVYLVPEVNAGVLARGGFLGQGSQRVMIIGLPLLDALTVWQFRAVLAHEFGHYHGGDVKLGPWIYRTRETIGRTIRNLSRRGLLQMPFLVYGRLFLRTTQAISRQQEFAADALAARTVGSAPLINGLRRIHAAALAFSTYWREEFVPVVNAGFRVPFVSGFRQFTTNERVAGLLDTAVKEEESNPRLDPYDSHPPLGARIAAVELLPAGPPGGDESPALSLLGDPVDAERSLLDYMLKPGALLRDVAWENVGAEVIVPQMRKRTEPLLHLLGDATVAQLPDLAKTAPDLGRRIATAQDRKLPDGVDPATWGVGLLGDSLTLALASNGWTIESPLGSSISARRGTSVIQPYEAVQALSSAKADPHGWMQQVEALGIGPIRLASRSL